MDIVRPRCTSRQSNPLWACHEDQLRLVIKIVAKLTVVRGRDQHLTAPNLEVLYCLANKGPPRADLALVETYDQVGQFE